MKRKEKGRATPLKNMTICENHGQAEQQCNHFEHIATFYTSLYFYVIFVCFMSSLLCVLAATYSSPCA